MMAYTVAYLGFSNGVVGGGGGHKFSFVHMVYIKHDFLLGAPGFFLKGGGGCPPPPPPVF